MYKEKRIAVVVPAYNVEKQIVEVVRTIPAIVDYIIVVDDSSKDRTYEVCKGIEDQRLIVLRNPTNLGVGGATTTGFKMAMKLDADIVVKMDGDGQMDPRYLKPLLEPLIAEHYSYAKGNRFLHSQALRTMPKIRLFGNFALTFLTKIVSGYWHIFDPQNGYVAIQKGALQDLNLDKLARRYFFENDMLVNLNIYNHRVKDVGMPAIYGDQPSFLKVRRIIFSFPVYLFSRFCHRVYQKYILVDFSPIALFLLSGLPLILWGAIYGGYIWWRALHSGTPATTGTIMLAVLPFLVGFELLLQGFILDINESPR